MMGIFFSQIRLFTLLKPLHKNLLKKIFQSGQGVTTGETSF
jgi:hypothetical protein